MQKSIMIKMKSQSPLILSGINPCAPLLCRLPMDVRIHCSFHPTSRWPPPGPLPRRGHSSHCLPGAPSLSPKPGTISFIFKPFITVLVAHNSEFHMACQHVLITYFDHYHHPSLSLLLLFTPCFLNNFPSAFKSCLLIFFTFHLGEKHVVSNMESGLSRWLHQWSPIPPFFFAFFILFMAE